MIFGKTISFAIAIMSVTAMVCIVEDADGSHAEGEIGTLINPYMKNLSIVVGETSYTFVTANLEAFDYVLVGDCFQIQLSSEMKKVTVGRYVQAASPSNNFTDWPEVSSDTTLVTDNLSIYPVLLEDTGLFAIHITLLKEQSCGFDLCLSVKSYGQLQYAYYHYDISPIPTDSYTISFDEPTVLADGVFKAVGTLKANGVVVEDLSDYSFFAKGLYRGVSIHNDLTISGRIDDTDNSNWSKGVMNFTISVSKVGVVNAKLVDASINYTIDKTISGITFNVLNGKKTIVDNQKGGGTVNVLAGTDLSFNMSNGTVATIIYEKDGTLEETTLYTTLHSNLSRSLPTNGAGTYTIYFSQITSSSTMQVSINVIAPLVPTNNIIITCGPAS